MAFITPVELSRQKKSLVLSVRFFVIWKTIFEDKK